MEPGIERPERTRRFYQAVTLDEVATGWQPLLDGRPLKTPGGTALALPTHALARRVEDEWDAQETHILPDTMPLTSLANTCLERVAKQRSEMEAAVRAYLETDLLSYPAEGPESLLKAQAELWDPELDWVRTRFDASLSVATGLMPLRQDPAVLERLARPLAQLDAWRFTAAQLIAATTGSFVLMLAALEGRHDAAALAARAFLPERHQAERWGQDPELSAALAVREADLRAALVWLAALEQD